MKDQKFVTDSDQQIRMSLAADFGAGTVETSYVSNELVSDAYDPQYTIHLGDVYFLGTASEINSNMFGIPPLGVTNGVKWPMGSIGSFSLNGNHEMYSLGYGYFDTLLPKFGIHNEGQTASYFSLENAYWRIIALDTGYNTYNWLFQSNQNKQPQQVMDWLVNEVKISDPTDKRGIIFISHHQYYSAFNEKGYPDTPTQIASVIPPYKKVLWLWGHEHRLSFYNLTSGYGLSNLTAYGRCVGFGGFPVTRSDIPSNAAQYDLFAYDNRVYTTDEGILPIPIGFNGFTRLNFSSNTLNIEYRSLRLDSSGQSLSPESELLAVDSWSVDDNGDVILTDLTFYNHNLTFVYNY